MRDRSCHQTKSCNEDHEGDLNYTLEMCRWLMRPLGMWTLVYHRVSRLEKSLAILLQIASFSSLLFVILPSAYNMFFVEEDLKNIVKLLGPVSFCTSSTIKYFILSLKGDILGRCIKHLEKDWRMVKDPYHRAIMLKQASISRFLITVCVAFLYSGGMSYHTVVQFLSKHNTNSSVTFRPIAYPCFKFLNIQSSPTYEIVFFLHCVSALVQYTITSAGYSMAAIFVTHICGQIEIQISRLDELVNEGESKTTLYDRISIIVRDHAEVMRFSKDVDEALREVCLTQIAESTLNMCMLEYYSLTEWRSSDMISILTYIMLLVSFTFIVFIFCYIGENLSEQCSRMGPASYEVPWYNLPPSDACNLILVNAIAQYPPKLTDTSMQGHNCSSWLKNVHNCVDNNWLPAMDQNHVEILTVMFTKNTTDYIVKLLGPVGLISFCTVKYIYLILKAKPLGRCVQHLERDWQMVVRPNHRSIMLKYSSISRKLIVVCVVFLYSGGISYHTVKQFITKDTSSVNVTERPFVYPPIKFINPQASPNYEIIFFVHCVSGVIQYTITSAMYSLAAIFVTHICGQIEIQISRLNELIEESREKRVFYDRMGTIVREHAEVLRFSKDVEEALRELNLTEIAESAVIMCVLEFYCMIEWRRSDAIALLTYFTLLVSFTFNIMIFCYVGELLTEQCSQMGPASYDIEWYKLPPRRAYNLILISAISLEPPKLTAGNIIDLSINTFGAVVRTSVIYLNLLRTVTV